MKKRKIGEVLIEEGLVTAEQVETAIVLQRAKNKKLGKILIELGYVTEEQVARGISKQLSLPLVDINNFTITNELLSMIPKEMAEKKIVFPLDLKDRELLLAMADPFDLEGVKDIQFYIGRSVTPAVAPETSIIDAIEKHYSPVELIWDMLKEIPTIEEVEFVKESPEGDLHGISTESLIKLGQAPPIVKLATIIFVDAIKTRASDVHIEPRGKYIQVRYRIDGELRNIIKYPKSIHDSIVSRIKIISELDITIKRLPQDGSCTFRIEGRDINLRVSTLPATYGENIVIRILDSSAGLVPLSKIGIDDEIMRPLLNTLTKPQGLVLVTGPTGSGKTTTLYAFLRQLKTESDNVISIEDPIEYKIPGVTQVGINEASGLSFPVALRSIFRQDPDVVMLGEIRDIETAEIAIRAALTGHLVLSTIHTNDTVSTITRLLDLGLPAYLVSSAVTGVLAQRLIKKICPTCKTKIDPPNDLLKDDYPILEFCYKGKGCKECQYTGYSGRIGIFEFLKMDANIIKLISKYTTEDELWEAAKESGIKTLFEDAWNKVKEGITTIEEALINAPYDPLNIVSEKTARKNTRILLFNLLEEDIKITKSILEPEGYKVVDASEKNMLEETIKYSPDLIMIDASREEYSLIKNFKSNFRGALTPIFAISNVEDKSKDEIFGTGIKDFIYRPLTPKNLFYMLHVTLKE
ncbi:MAG: Flp pilus assembly complex ATPase component TadA [Deltaproteobacteria bacterium]|nr:Flp pilus assembly complex ATPase component TadA [Deltaproteobacteria bacterium]